MTSAKFSGFWTPSLPLSAIICFSYTPSPLLNVIFILATPPLPSEIKPSFRVLLKNIADYIKTYV